MTKCVSESRILAERVYIRPKAVSERNKIANCVFESKILAERVYITPQSASESKRKQENIEMFVWEQESSKTYVH